MIQFTAGEENGHCESFGKGEIPSEKVNSCKDCMVKKLLISILCQWNGNICMQLLFIK